jgi:hypothetical protein
MKSFLIRTLNITLCAILAGMLSRLPARAQAIVTPNSHWGGIMVPDLTNRVDIGVHMLGFTQYGKEFTPGTGDFTFKPYNDIDETLGFNLFTYTRTGYEGRFPIIESSLQTRTSYVVGIIDDHIPEFFQNDVAHWGNYRGQNRLPRVPRKLHDTPDSTSRGPTKSYPVLSYSKEYFIRFEQRRRLGAEVIQSPSRFFVGGGFAVGTINHEAFVHIGTNPVEWTIPDRVNLACPVLCVNTLGIGGVARAGVLSPSHHFRDLTADFSNLQGLGEVNASIIGFPFSVGIAITGARGFFVEERTAADHQIIAEREEPMEKVYEVKRPKQERFFAAQLRMGGFTFDFVNDFIGGKDKGPSFGVGASLDATRNNWLRCQAQGYFGSGGSDEAQPSKRWLRRTYETLRQRLTCR